MRVLLSALALTCAALTTGCGGGSSSNGPSGGPTTTAASVSMSGVASKGLMANATVTVHAVNPDGSVNGTPLASTTTDADGHYTLTFDAVKDTPYVIRVTATATTTHLDEVSGVQQPLPEGFTMRALYVPTASGSITTQTSVTPFSEMAAAAAARAPGALTLANVQQATSTVTQLLGFNPASVEAKTAGNATTADEQRLAMMLTAVSKMAANGDLGCDTESDGGARTQCVVGELAAATTKDSLKLQTTHGATTTDVSAALQTALAQVLGNFRLNGSIPSSTLVTALRNLSCSDSACTPGSVGNGTPSTTASAIAATKAMLLQIKSDWLSLFEDSPSSMSAVQVEGLKVAMGLSSNLELPGDVMLRDLGALVAAVDLLHGARTDPSWSRLNVALSSGLTPPQGDAPSPYGFPPIRCQLVSDTATGTAATNAAEAVGVSCRAVYTGRLDTPTSYTDLIHGFSVTQNDDGSYQYTSKARQRTVSLPDLNAAPTLVDSSGAYTGTVAATFNPETGKLASFSIAGALPPAWRQSPTAFELINDHHTWSVSGSITDPASGSFTLAGSITGYSAADTASGTLALDRGVVTMGMLGGNKVITAADLGLSWTTAEARFSGALRISDPVLPKVGSQQRYGQGEIAGTLSSMTNGVESEFFTLRLVASMSGYEQFDTTAPSGPDNTFNVGASLIASITAPDRPKVEFTLSSSSPVHDLQVNTMTLQYRSFAAGSSSPTNVITIAAQRTDSGASVTLSEAVTGVSIAWASGDRSVDVKYGDAVIGVFDGKLLTFSDGSFQSVDLGL